MKAVPIPLWTLAICATAVAVFTAPQLEALLVYNREAIGRGELWRIVTGNLVHFSTAHLVRDLIALLVTGALIETARYRNFPLLCLASAMLIGVVLYFLEPQLLVYGGLSGMVTAAVVYLCLNGLDEQGIYRWLCLAALACLAAKTGVESGLGIPLEAGPAPGQFVVVPASHAAGAVTALLLFALASMRREEIADQRGGI